MAAWERRRADTLAAASLAHCKIYSSQETASRRLAEVGAAVARCTKSVLATPAELNQQRARVCSICRGFALDSCDAPAGGSEPYERVNAKVSKFGAIQQREALGILPATCHAPQQLAQLGHGRFACRLAVLSGCQFAPCGPGFLIVALDGLGNGDGAHRLAAFNQVRVDFHLEVDRFHWRGTMRPRIGLWRVGRHGWKYG